MQAHCSSQMLGRFVALPCGFAARSMAATPDTRGLADFRASTSPPAAARSRSPRIQTSPTVGSITISFADLAGDRRAHALPDPIVPLYGGPGEQVIGEAGFVARQFATLRGQRDILLVDQRGTGRSSALRCRLFDPASPAIKPAALRAAQRQSKPARANSSARADLDAIHVPALRAGSRTHSEGARLFAVQPVRRVLRHARGASLHACVSRRAFVRSSSASVVPTGPHRRR